MKTDDIRKKFREFFEKRGHKWVPSSSLLPDDPSVLFTTAGMQQFKRYFTGELNAQKDFGSLNTVSIQKCFRTSDIDEVGDNSHLTFFEMLGNFSFGGYWKKEAITYAYEFITKELKLPIDYVTYFDPAKVSAGDWRKNVPKDEESRKIWESLGVKDVRPDGTDVFWGPTGNEGPCGPTTEIYVAGMEIWNIVFNEFYRDTENKLTTLKTKGVDTGMGLERLAAITLNASVAVDKNTKNKKEDSMINHSTMTHHSGSVYETDELKEIMSVLPNGVDEKTKKIITDHMRGVVFLIADGIKPSNKEAGYVLRRLIRNIVVHKYLSILTSTSEINLESVIKLVVGKYKNIYQDLDEKKVLSVFHEESGAFLKTLQDGLKETKKYQDIDADLAFNLYQNYGLPFEVIKKLESNKTKNLTRKAFEEKFKKHQEISRAGAEKKFGGHGLILDTGELKAKNEEELKKVLALHTATHILHQALRETLGNEVGQRGSDITPERARFDFTFPRKMTSEEITQTEKIINEKIKADMPVLFKEMKKEEAEKTGALHFFNGKYPETVKVYFISPDGTLANAWSKEFCNGPHITHTGEIGAIKIIKEEASSAGVRRIRIALIP